VANVASSTSILGGVIGKCEGKIENCSILSSPELSAYSSKSQSSDITNCKIYLGGVIGYLAQNGIENCPIVKATARLRACDFTDMFGGISIAGLVDVAKESNGSSAVHPAGGIIGCMAGASYVSGSSFEVGGSVGSLGYKGSSDKGTISGGFIGLLESDFTGNVKKNYFKMAASLSVTFLNSMDISSADDWAETFGFNNWLEDHSWAKSLAEAAGYTIRHICTYAGEWIGRSFVSGGSSNMTDNVIFINGYNDMIEGGTNLNNGDYDVSVGLICGDEQSALSGCIGANNWLVRKLSECDTGRLMGNEFKYGNFNHINVFGDGIISTYFSGNTLKARAVPGMSPFYGWTSNPSASAKDIRFEVGEYNLSSSSGQVLYAMFIDQSVGSSGELTQLANDINLIKSYAWENLFKPADPENPDYKTHFTGSSKITLDWLNVSLTSDILVRQGTPVIEDFYGTFDGNGHTITYAAGSSITHKYEKYASEDGTYEEFATGLFGTIMNGATVKNVNIVFGGSITENKGLVFDTVEGAGDQLSALKETKDGTPESVESRRTAYDAFAFPSSLDLDQCYVYFLAGDDYNISRDYNRLHRDRTLYLQDNHQEPLRGYSRG